MSLPASFHQASSGPWRPDSGDPGDGPGSLELIAALAVALLLTHLLLAQLTLLLAVAFYLIGRLSRWRLLWLAVPAAAGLLWTLAIGPARAAAGLTAGPRQVLDYLGGIGRHPGHLLHLQDAFAGITQWLPQQFPLALILAAAEVLGVFWLQGQWDGGRGYRPGLVVALRRRGDQGRLLPRPGRGHRPRGHGLLAGGGGRRAVHERGPGGARRRPGRGGAGRRVRGPVGRGGPDRDRLHRRSRRDQAPQAAGRHRPDRLALAGRGGGRGVHRARGAASP